MAKIIVVASLKFKNMSHGIKASVIEHKLLNPATLCLGFPRWGDGDSVTSYMAPRYLFIEQPRVFRKERNRKRAIFRGYRQHLGPI